MTNKNMPPGAGFCFGIGLGLVFGIALDNLAIGVSLGVALGAAFSARKNDDGERSSTSPSRPTGN
ncbi:hypothetical protein [Streptosporangium amethystogenes]|uniref:hypothetical protein n=1 Tax=Streptosporangium amethystogenes TaxID=2002 RepID=UPI00146FD710|nr:hypothetical protein [Streptosporangium amethystogenes]